MYVYMYGQCAFSGVEMSLSWKFQLRKKDKVFLKRLQLFFNRFVKEKGKLCLTTKGAFHTF